MTAKTYTTSEAARLLGGLNTRTVQGYIRQGNIKADRKVVGMDFHYVISREEIERFAGKYGIEIQELEELEKPASDS